MVAVSYTDCIVIDRRYSILPLDIISYIVDQISYIEDLRSYMDLIWILYGSYMEDTKIWDLTFKKIVSN